MPTVIATAGSASANSFASVQAADDYCDARLNASAWNTDADDDAKARALIDASRELSALESILQGYRTDAIQALAFPRRCVINTKAPVDAVIGITGYPEFADDIVPADWIAATCELALAFLKAGSTDLAAQDATAGVIRKKTDVLETEWASPAQRAQGLARFPRVMGLVSQFFDVAATGGLTIVRT